MQLDRQYPENRRVITLVVFCAIAISGFCCYFSTRLDQVNGKLDALETVRVGIPIEYLDAKGFRPFEKVAVEYEGKPAEYRLYRSSGTGYLRSQDFVVVINAEGIIVATFPVTSQTAHQSFLKRLKVDDHY